MDLGNLLRQLRSERGIEYLLCEGGPTLYGHLARGGWVDEKFITIAPQEIGPGIPPEQEWTDWEKRSGAATRPTSFAGTGFTLEEAPWYRWISCRKAGDHELNRYRRTASAVVSDEPPLARLVPFWESGSNLASFRRSLRSLTSWISTEFNERKGNCTTISTCRGVSRNVKCNSSRIVAQF